MDLRRSTGSSPPSIRVDPFRAPGRRSRKREIEECDRLAVAIPGTDREEAVVAVLNPLDRNRNSKDASLERAHQLLIDHAGL